MPNLVGKSVLITGASRGIGAATAREFAKQGASVLLTARTAGAIYDIATEINEQGGNARHLSVDVSNPQDVQAAVDLAVSEFGGLDIAIANAGIIDPIARIEDSDPTDWGRLIDINVKGVYHVMRAALPVMKPNGGTIISIGSGAATVALEGWAHYSASKAAVHHLNACLHKEEGENNIRALVLSPGTVATEMQVSIKDSQINPVSQIPWEDHIPADWAAKTLV
jgi:NAD(P)-dependent dehydrogenase (short-subunit alcohol dehydrogenase family)